MYCPRGLNELQEKIVTFISVWGKKEDKPIPIRSIIEEMEKDGTSESRIIRAVRGLVKKKYIRRAIDRSSRSSYVKLRGI